MVKYDLCFPPCSRVDMAASDLERSSGFFRSRELSATVCAARFWWQGAAGVAAARSCQKLPPCLVRPVPAGSERDPPLAKAKPVSDGGSASGVT